MAHDPPLPSSSATNLAHWLPPLNPHCKVNFDGAVFQYLYLGGIMVVIRDSEGLVVAALPEKITLPPSMDAVEALACRRAISFALEIGF